MKKLGVFIKNQTEDIQDTYPKIEELPDGNYTGLFYAYTFELPDGRKFKTPYGIKCGRWSNHKETFEIKNHKLTNYKYDY